MPLAKVTPDLASYKAALRACEAGGLRELALRLLKSSSVVDEQSDRCPERSKQHLVKHTLIRFGVLDVGVRRFEVCLTGMCSIGVRGSYLLRIGGIARLRLLSHSVNEKPVYQ